MPITKARLKISDYNEGRKSRLRTQERRVKMVSLSLTSMVDMFAILVIFLLANMDSFTEWTKVGHGIELPTAKSRAVPERATTLQISSEGIFGEDQLLIPLSQQNLAPLRQWLARLEKKNGYINIVAHQKISFGLMKRIIIACQESGFHRVNLAVQPKG